MTTDTVAAEHDRLDAIRSEVDEHRHGRVPRELRLRQVLAAAEVLFVEQGYAATSMDDLARLVGVSKPVIYDLVGSKEKVFQACMERVADELSAAVADAVEAAAGDDPTGLVSLRAGALAWFRFIETRRAVWDSLLASADAPASAAIESIRARQDAFVAEQLAGGLVAAGRPVDDELVGAIATAMNGAFEALGRWWHDHQDHSADELADLYTSLLLPGLLALQTG